MFCRFTVKELRVWEYNPKILKWRFLNQSKYLINVSLSHLCDSISEAVILLRGLLVNNFSKKL